MPTNNFARFRLAVFGLASYLAVANLVMAYHCWGRDIYEFVIGQAAAILTLVTIPPFLLLSILRKGAFPSMVIFEYFYTGILWMCWLAVGIVTQHAFAQRFRDQPYSTEDYVEEIVFMALSFSTCLILLLYNVVLLVLASRGESYPGRLVWTNYIAEVDFSGASPQESPILPQIATPQNLSPVMTPSLHLEEILIPQTYYVPQQTISPPNLPQPAV